ncbi:MAG: NADH-quinone oxidoreductase subunit NuoH [Anaerolineales bacterium]|nr:MAG: NADH-quinone oxidoreductase subunit NuoH [Anaerolineales bacterium]
MGDPITLIGKWLENLLYSWGLMPGVVSLIMAVIGVVVIASAVLVLDILLVWVERKVVARFQDRLGPNRVGPFGIIQPIADVIKLLIKEDILPIGADKIVYNLAPIMALGTVLLLWAVLPLSSTVYGTNLNVGVLYIVALGAISTLGIIMAGWASNNKYALLGAFRTVAQMVSYEVPLVIALLVPVILARSMGLTDIVEAQSIWFVFIAPIPALIVLITSIAELGRAPFDLIEAESEIVAGFHIEYTGMKFGLFYAGELLHALTVGGIIATLFLGGWRGPGAETYPILGIFYFFIKALFLYWVIMWIKYSLPRIRIDHMLNFNWKFLTPLSLVILIVMAIVDKIVPKTSMLVYSLVMLFVNVVVGWLTLQLLRRNAKSARMRVAEPKPVARPEPSPTAATSQTSSSSS